MAGKSELEIGLKIDGVRKSFMEIKNEAKTLGKSKIELFSKEEKDFLKVQSKKMLEDIKKKMEDNKSMISKQVKEMKNLERGTVKYAKAEADVNKLLKERTKIMKVNKEYSQFDQAGFGKKGGLPSQLGGIGKKGMSLSGGRMGMLSRLGPMGMMAGGLLGAGAFGLSRVMGGVGTFKQGVGDRIGMRGLGMGDMDVADKDRASNAGLSAQDMRSRRLASGRILGKEGGSQESVLRRAEFERNFGLEGGSQMGLATQLRGSVGGQKADQTVMKLQGSIIAAGIEDSIGPYLETATQLLASLNENGMMNSEQMIGALATLVKDGKNTPEQVAKAFQTLNSSISGSSGEANAFFQQAFAGAGIGDNTIGGSKLAIEAGGLFGMSKQGLSDRGFGGDLVNTLGNLGVTSGLQERGGAILKNVKGLAGIGQDQDIDTIKDPKQVTMLSRFANNIFGTKGLEGLTNIKMLEDALEGGPNAQKKFQQAMEQQAKSPELKALDAIKESNAGQTQSLEKMAETIKDELGNKFVPAANRMVELLTSIDKTIGAVASWFGVTSPTEDLNNQIAGKDVINQKEFDAATAGNPEAQKEASKKAAAEYIQLAEKEKKLQEYVDKFKGGSARSGTLPSDYYSKQSELRDVKERRGNIQESSMHIKGFDPAVNMTPEQRNKFNQDNMARTTKEPGIGDFIKEMMGMGQKTPEVNNKEMIEAVKENTEAVKGKRTTINVQTPSGVRNSKTVPN